MYSVVFCSHSSLFSIILTAFPLLHPASNAVSGLVRQTHIVPTRRFREELLESLKLSTGGAGA